MPVITDFDQIVTLVKRQHAAYLTHPVLSLTLKSRNPGGYFSLFDVTTRSPVADPELIVQFNDPVRGFTCRTLSLEKGTRLLSHPTHILSRESEDPDDGKYAGAVRGTQFVASYSGDPAHIDELKMLALLVEIGDLTKEKMLEILQRFPNNYVQGRTEDFFLD